jgi:DNA-binding MarR family transcriptional regulator
VSSSTPTAQHSVAVATFVRLLRVHAAITRGLSSELQAEHGLTINDYEALLLLSRAEGGRMRRVDLASELLLTASGITRLLEGLEQCGLVTREACEADRRVIYAVLTAEGRRRLERAAASHVAAVRELFEAHLDDDELDRLSELLGRLPGAGAAAGGDACGA